MDGNKDEALKCLRIGRESLDAGDRTRAVKFLTKARQLDPSLPVDELLSSAIATQEGTGGERESRKAPSSTDGGSTNGACCEPENPIASRPSSSPKLRNRTRFSSAAEGSSSSSRTYTEEQITVVREINMQKDYYQTLGLERSCSIEEVRKAYRKTSLKVHPDKNSAPGAEEAFKAVSKAFQCLSNEESRKRYDMSGLDEPSHTRAPTRHQAHGFSGFYETDDFDPDEIFRNFFFGGMAPASRSFGTFHFRAGGMHGQNMHGTHANGGFNLRALIQILPVLILLLVNFLPSSSPVYALSRSYPYENKVETPRGVPYFVKSAKFEEEYPYQSSERNALERHVERDFFGILTQNCRVELQRQQWGLTNQIPHCDMLRKFEETAV